MVFAHLVGRVYTALGARTNGVVYGLFVALLPVTLICASLQWANCVVRACINGSAFVRACASNISQVISWITLSIIFQFLL